ncbi:MAG: glycosyltransferase [Pseudomonadales bacterium]
MRESIIYGGLWILERVLRLLAAREPAAIVRAPHIVLTGTFHSANWIRAHLLPMVNSGAFGQITLITTSDVEYPIGVRVIKPYPRLRHWCGETISRLGTFCHTVAKERPDYVSGFHLLFNGLLAILLARMISRRAIYFCVGGPAEVTDGGLLSENRLLSSLKKPSKRIESVLLSIASRADLIVCMGNGAASFYRSRTQATVLVNPGGVPPIRPSAQPEKSYDLIFLGRLAPIKNLQVLLEAVAELNKSHPVTLAIVGAGELDSALKSLAVQLGIENRVTFAGMQKDTVSWLRSARIFVLPSVSEGLSLSLMEAMSAGLPAVVSDVGDLGDLVRNEFNGILLQDVTGAKLASAIAHCLDKDVYERLCGGASEAAAQVLLGEAESRWKGLNIQPRPESSECAA